MKLFSMKLFSCSSSSKVHATMSCGLKVDTQSPGWDRTLNKVLRKFNGVRYSIDAEEGMALITGRANPNKILKKLAKAGRHAEICWVESGNVLLQSNGGGGYPYQQPSGHQYPPPPYAGGYVDNGSAYYPHGGYQYPQQGYSYPMWG